MKIFFVPGVACSSWIWHKSSDYLDCDAVKLDWPGSCADSFGHMDDVTDYLLHELQEEAEISDVIVAHSMGGLATLELVAERKISFDRVIIVEAFLNPPEKFFQNLHSELIAPDLAGKIKQMLKIEKVKFREELIAYLREFHYDFIHNKVNKLMNIDFIYGDRAEADKALIQRKLDWPQSFTDEVSTHFITGSCHLPMLENPDEFYGLINKLIHYHPIN